MKKLAIALCLTASVLTSMAQGTLNFSTYNGTTVDAQVTYGGTAVTGPDFVGQLFGNNAGSWEAIGSPVAFFGAGTGGEGYIVSGSVSVAFVAPGADAELVLRAWNSAAGSDWDTASTNPNRITGESAPFSVTTGGAGSPPSLPADLVGLSGFSVQAVPEPSTIALGLIGLAALAIRRRK